MPAHHFTPTSPACKDRINRPPPNATNITIDNPLESCYNASQALAETTAGNMNIIRDDLHYPRVIEKFLNAVFSLKNEAGMRKIQVMVLVLSALLMDYFGKVNRFKFLNGKCLFTC